MDAAIRFRLLGSTELVHPHGPDPGELLRKPKPLALLAYLAVTAPGGFHRRDTLLGLFWPEGDWKHARHDLRQTLYRLRRVLGRDVVLERGREEVGVATARLWCDAVAFEQALDAGALGDALDLYRGDLLGGFFLSGALEFERWLERERARLKGRATGAAWLLAQRAELEGDPQLAVEWARRAAALSPYDEAALRRLVALLDRVGDRAGALDAYARFAGLLQEDYGSLPDPETRRLVEAVQAGDAGPPASLADSRDLAPGGAPSLLLARPSAAGERHVPQAERALPSKAPEWTPVPGRRPQRTAHRRAALAAAAGLLAVVVAVALWRSGRNPAPDSGATPTAVAVFPFLLRGGDEVRYLEEGLADLVSTALDGAGELHAIDPRTVFSTVRANATGALDESGGRALAERLDARFYVLGSVIQSGAQLRVAATLFDRHRRWAPVTVNVEGEVTELFELVDGLAAGLVAERSRTPLARLAARTTTSLPALKAYLDGEQAFRAGRFAAARDAFRQAVSLDTAFALGYYRLSLAELWSGSRLESLRWAEHALTRAERLPERQRSLLEALLAWRSGRADEAETIYRALSGTYPEDVELWHQLGETLIHNNPLRGRPIAEARQPFERVLTVEPGNWGALWHLAQLEAAAGRSTAFDGLMARLLEAGPERGRALEIRTMRAYADHDRAAQQALSGDLAAEHAGRIFTLVWRVSVYLGNVAGAARLAELLTDPARPREIRAQGHALVAELELARGRWRAARQALAQLARLDPVSALEYEAFFASLPLTPVAAGELEALRDAMLGISSTGESAALVSWHDGAHRHLHAYLIGLLTARLQQPVAAERWAALLEELADPPGLPNLSADLARAVRAHVAWWRGDRTTALEVLETIALERWYEYAVESPFYSHAYERYLRAEALRALGRAEEAVGWYASLAEHAPGDLILLGPALLGLVELHRQTGAPQRAAGSYRRLLELWRDADPELQPVLASAAAQLAALREP